MTSTSDVGDNAVISSSGAEGRGCGAWKMTRCSRPWSRSCSRPGRSSWSGDPVLAGRSQETWRDYSCAWKPPIGLKPYNIWSNYYWMYLHVLALTLWASQHGYIEDLKGETSSWTNVLYMWSACFRENYFL